MPVRVLVCGEQSDTRAGVSPRTSCQYRCTNAPYSSATQYRSVEKDNWAKPGSLPAKQCFLSDMREI